MGEISTEIPDSLIPAATVKAERIAKAVRRLSAAVQIELIDTDLNPADLDDARREDLARLSNELLGFLHAGQSLLSNIIEAGSLGVEKNGGGLPLRISAGNQVLELETGSPNGDSPAAEPAAEEETALPEEVEEPAEQRAVSKKEADEELPEVEVIIDGFARLDNKELNLTTPHEISVLKALPALGGKPLTRRWMMDKGFYADAKSDSSRFQAFGRAVEDLIVKLEAAAGQKLLDKVGIKGGTRYEVRLPFKVDGADVVVSDEVKKN